MKSNSCAPTQKARGWKPVPETVMVVEHLGWAHFGIPPLAAWAVAVMEVVTAEHSAQISMVLSTAPSTAQYNNAKPCTGHSSPPQHSHNGQHSTPKFSTQISAQTCGTEQHSTAQHRTAHNTAQHRTSRHSTAQHSTAQHRFQSLLGVMSQWSYVMRFLWC